MRGNEFSLDNCLSLDNIVLVAQFLDYMYDCVLQTEQRLVPLTHYKGICGRHKTRFGRTGDVSYDRWWRMFTSRFLVGSHIRFDVTPCRRQLEKASNWQSAHQTQSATELFLPTLHTETVKQNGTCPSPSNTVGRKKGRGENGGSNSREKSNTRVRTVVSRLLATPSLWSADREALPDKTGVRKEWTWLCRHHLLTVVTDSLNTT